MGTKSCAKVLILPRIFPTRFRFIFYGQKCCLTVSYDEVFPGNFGVGGVKNFLGKKNRSLQGNFPKFSGKISSPGKFGSNSPSRGNFEAQNFLETTGNFTRKFLDHFILELKSVPFPCSG